MASHYKSYGTLSVAFICIEAFSHSMKFCLSVIFSHCFNAPWKAIIRYTDFNLNQKPIPFVKVLVLIWSRHIVSRQTSRFSVNQKFWHYSWANWNFCKLYDLTKEYIYDNHLTNCINVFIDVTFYIFIKQVGYTWESIGLMSCI